MPAPPSEHPSGQQHEIAHGDKRAVVVEVGGGLRSFSEHGFDVLDGYQAGEMCTAARGQPLIPWPNRIRDGRYTFAGQEEQLPLTEPERQTSIHGLLRWSRWRCLERTDARVLVESVLYPQPGYPFTLVAGIDYALGPDGLRVAITGRNAGQRPLPYAAGQHPYIRVAPGLIDEAVVQSPAQTRLVADGRGIPTGEQVPVAGEYDLRRPEPLGARVLDTAFTDLGRDADGRARVVMRGPEREVTVWLDEGFSHLMLFTGDTLEEGRRRRGLGVEPMTCAPNAFQSGDGLRVLDPGESFTAAWGVRVRSLG